MALTVDITTIITGSTFGLMIVALMAGMIIGLWTWEK